MNMSPEITLHLYIGKCPEVKSAKNISLEIGRVLRGGK